jgi:hypothetical protein
LLLALLSAGTFDAQAKSKTSLVTTVGAAGSQSFSFGTELWALSEIRMLPEHKIGLEIVEVPEETVRLSLLHEGSSHFTLVRGQVPTSLAHQIRGVMALWPDGIVASGAEPVQLLVHAAVPEDLVYRVTDMIFEHGAALGSIDHSLRIQQPREAMVGMSLPVHPGAYRYYEEQGLSFDDTSPLTARRRDALPIDDASDRAALEPHEVKQLSAACRDAVARGALDLFDDDDQVGFCGNHGVDGETVALTGSSNGQGGPEVAAHEGNVRHRALNASADDQKAAMPGGQAPTM